MSQARHWMSMQQTRQSIHALQPQSMCALKAPLTHAHVAGMKLPVPVLPDAPRARLGRRVSLNALFLVSAGASCKLLFLTGVGEKRLDGRLPSSDQGW